jgi:hypothetical protein
MDKCKEVVLEQKCKGKGFLWYASEKRSRSMWQELTEELKPVDSKGRSVAEALPCRA